MAQDHNPDALRGDQVGGNELNRSQAPLDNELVAERGIAERPAGGSRVAIIAVAVVVILGAVFYGLNNAALPPPATSTASQTTTQPAPKADQAPNSETGMTTGAATSRPRAPQAPTSGAPDPAPSATR